MNPQNGVVELIEQVDAALERAHTQSLDLSLNEILEMKKASELIIDPDYQRLFQWSEGAQSRFIESLLLGMPVPPIYVIEDEIGRYLLIDGLQRISSYLHLRGQLEAEHKEIKLGDKLVLNDCDIVAALNGKTFEDLGTTLQIRLKRAFIRVEVVKRTSDVRFKYHMFKRLNTGGEKLTDQQIRNCTIRLLSPIFNDYMANLCKYSSFEKCVEILTEDQKNGWFDRELVLRFFAIKNARQFFKHDVSDFLTDYMEGVSEPNPIAQINFNYQEEDSIFKKTFDFFAQSSLADKSFGYPNKARTNITRGFSTLHFEALSIGIQPFLNQIDLGDSTQIATLSDTIHSLKLDPDFIKLTSGGGKNSSGLLKARIEYVTTWLSKSF